MNPAKNLGRPPYKLTPIISLPDKYNLIQQGISAQGHPLVLCMNRFDGVYHVISVEKATAKRIVDEQYPTLNLARKLFDGLMNR